MLEPLARSKPFPSLDIYLTIQSEQTPEGAVVGVGNNDGVETNEPLDRSWDGVVGAEGGI
jgi:hypothetical protein